MNAPRPPQPFFSLNINAPLMQAVNRFALFVLLQCAGEKTLSNETNRLIICNLQQKVLHHRPLRSPSWTRSVRRCLGRNRRMPCGSYCSAYCLNTQVNFKLKSGRANTSRTDLRRSIVRTTDRKSPSSVIAALTPRSPFRLSSEQQNLFHYSHLHDTVEIPKRLL